MVKVYFALPLAVAGLVSCGGQTAEQKESASGSATVAKAVGVGCFGRIRPADGTFSVSPYTSGGRAPVVAELRIKEGDNVAKGQIIAVLEARPYLESAVREAESRVKLAQQRLARARMPMSLDQDIATVRAEVSRLQLDRDAAARDYDRNKPLYDKDYVSKAQMDALSLRVQDADALITQANSRIAAMQAVRPEDVSIAESEVRVAEAELDRARQEMETSVVRTASAGHVLRVIAHAGELVGPEGIAELADTTRMAVVAEVYEADIARVHLGQKAEITSPLLAGPLNGEVVAIDPQIEKQEPLSIEPGAPSDARIFKVRIRVPDSGLIATRINAKVDVVIQPQEISK